MEKTNSKFWRIITFITIAILIISTGYRVSTNKNIVSSDNLLSSDENEVDLLQNVSPISDSLIVASGGILYNDFLSGNNITLNSKNYPHSQGVDISLLLPKNWEIKEGISNNIVFVASSPLSKDFFIQNNLTLLIRDNSKNLTIDDLKRKSMNDYSLQNGWNYIESGYFILNGRVFSWSTYDIVKENNGIKLFMKMIVYNTLMNDKFIQVQFSTVGPINKPTETESFFAKKVIDKEFLNDKYLYNAIMEGFKINNDK